MIKPIRTKKDYETALNCIYELMQKRVKKNSDEYNQLEVLSILVENYEEKHFPINPPDPIEAIKFRLDQLNMPLSVLGTILGSKSRVSEILNRKRKLNLRMILILNKELNIPLSSLIGE